MAVLSYQGETFTVDHAVKGADYVHGYDAGGVMIVSLDSVTDFTGISYSGIYMVPGECENELCNGVIYCAGELKTRGGQSVKTSQTYTATIGTTWSGSGPYTQDITVSGILATDKPIVDLVASTTFATAQAQIEAFACVYKIITAANKITVYATDATTTQIPIQMVVMR